MRDRQHALDLDAGDPLAGFRQGFDLEDGLIYLDGNSLGPLPGNVVPRLQKAVAEEWGRDLITSWNKHGWFQSPRRVGEMIAPLIGAAPGQVLAVDGTTLNLFKVMAAALKFNAGRHKIVSENSNFPTDLYIAQGLQELLGADRCELVTVDEDKIVDSIDDQTAVAVITEVNFRTGRLHDMKDITRRIQDRGALVCWDLCHSAGALPVCLDGCNADFAVGCGYKYLNGGPGAPAFVYVASRHQTSVSQPLSGWHGHASPFAFQADYAAAPGVEKFLCGTQPMLSMIALEESLKMWADVDMKLVREKSIRLCDAFIELVEEKCRGFGFELVTPRQAENRGSQVSFAHVDGYAVMQALIADKVIGDFRAPDLLRFGFTPLYTRHVDVWDAVERLRSIMENRLHDRPEFKVRAAVT